MIRVFPRKTKWTPIDELAFVGDPPLFRPPEQPVRISVTFTWDRAEGYRLQSAWRQFYQSVELHGPAFDNPGGEFKPGRFIKEGVTITSRGCPQKCPWCFVPQREGKIRELEIKPGWIVQDNNLLACSLWHLRHVFEMLQEQKRGIKFSGGLDPQFFNIEHRKLIEKIKVSELWFSCDSVPSFYMLQKVADLLADFPQNKKRCYVLIGFNGETLYHAESRLEEVYRMDFLPFPQLYRGPGERLYDKEWKALNRKWSRPAAYRSAING